MAYALKIIALFKIDCSTPNQACQIYVELVFCKHLHCRYSFLVILIKTQITERRVLYIKLLLHKTGFVQ